MPFHISAKFLISVILFFPGNYSISLYASKEQTGVTLTARNMSLPTKVLQSGYPIHPLVANTSTRMYFKFHLYSNTTASSLSILLFGGSGDADLYVSNRLWPNQKYKDYVSNRGGNRDSIIIRRPITGKCILSIINCFGV